MSEKDLERHIQALEQFRNRVQKKTYRHQIVPMKLLLQIKQNLRDAKHDIRG